MMEGFSDREPENWDLAVGTVRGYRWWNVTVPLMPAGMLTRPGDFWSERLSPDAYFAPATPAWVPSGYRAMVQGMHGGHWVRSATDGNKGKYRAACTTGHYLTLFPWRHDADHILDPQCSCGFWAYWNELPMEWNSCVPYVRRTDTRGFQREGYQLTLPVGGVIEGSGKTIIGERGFRCEYARITDMAFNVSGDCIFYDETQPAQEWRYDSSLHGVGPVVVPFGTGFVNPRNAGNFSDFMEQELGTHVNDIMGCVMTTVVNILGTDINWHQDTAALLKNCLPDKNYGNV